MALHRQQIDRFGGAPGLRDAGLLESAVLRAEYKWLYEPASSVAVLAASLAWGLIKNHAFVDGNKRIGFAAMVVFLDRNGYRLTCSEVEETAMVLRAAAGRSAKRSGRLGWKQVPQTSNAPNVEGAQRLRRPKCMTNSKEPPVFTKADFRRRRRVAALFAKGKPNGHSSSFAQPKMQRLCRKR